MFKISILILLSYAMVFTIIDPTAGGDPLLRNNEYRPHIEMGDSLVANEVKNTRFVNDERDYDNHSDCDLTCGPDNCCERGQKCGYDDGYFYCYFP